MIRDLLIADAHGRDVTEIYNRKSDPPRLGEKYGVDWATTSDRSHLQLPGGGLLLFDLERLTLQDYRAMRNHYQINISLTLLAFMVHQVNWRIEGENEKARAYIEENMRDVWSRLIRAISPAYWCGYSPIVLQYENDVNRVRLAKFKDIVPEHAEVAWKEVNGAISRPNGIPPKIKIYNGIKIPGHVDPVPADNTLWYSLLMENGDYRGRKLLKPAFPSWFFSQIIHLYCNRYFERFGEPLPIGRAPFGDQLETGDGVTTISGKKAMEDTLAGIMNRAIVVLPSDRISNPQGSKTDFEYSIEYLESQMRGADFERYLNRLDEEMSLGIFTPVLLYRTSDVGSYNLGEAHMQIFLIMTNALVADIAEYINKYVIDRLVAFNFGPTLVGKIRFIPKKMGEAAQATIRQIATALVQGGFAKPDLEDLGLELGMKLTEIEQVMEPAAPGVAVGADNKSKADAGPA
jgi:hypothetical protein